jgi:hypothetical protein
VQAQGQLEWIDEYFECIQEKSDRELCFKEVQEYYGGLLQVLGKPTLSAEEMAQRAGKRMTDARALVGDTQAYMQQVKAEVDPAIAMCMKSKLTNMMLGFDLAKDAYQNIINVVYRLSVTDVDLAKAYKEYALFNSLAQRIASLAQETDGCRKIKKLPRRILASPVAP